MDTGSSSRTFRWCDTLAVNRAFIYFEQRTIVHIADRGSSFSNGNWTSPLSRRAWLEQAIKQHCASRVHRFSVYSPPQSSEELQGVLDGAQEGYCVPFQTMS
ncbi:hypothetical protein AALO_G00231340 [Alosa alosa]|uniref:Uncharacterized protein n=1 Tax=Alosa alosa TaxID=278164 RepID=A0AAV6FV70_9TELE|nr:hypothetical protein AALO_G00231340 [Alosa alosa]